MNLTIDDFATFFSEVNGRPPFAWQQRLVEHLVTSKRWPDVIDAPTGSGKTSVVEAHAFVNALAHDAGLTVPRRLVMTVNRRSLVDDHTLHAKLVAARLSAAHEAVAPVTVKVAELLRRRAGGVGGQTRSPLSVHTVRGGKRLSLDWRSQPTECAVICMTPDMWGSRALFRGYGTSRNMRSMEAGLLVRDTVVVLDEAHLNRQLLTTARRIGQLDDLGTENIVVPGLQVVATTATPDDEGHSHTRVGVEPSDLAEGAAENALVARLTRPKPIQVRELDVRRDKTGPIATAIVDAALEFDSAVVGGTIGCVVNTVALARDVVREFKSRLGGTEAGVEVVVGGLAPLQANAVLDRLKGLGGDSDSNGSSPANRAPRFVIGTQALEVGIDIDFTALVTELAPGTALSQRFGRLNRIGRRPSGPITVVAPHYDAKDTLVPYTYADLAAALTWLERIAADPTGAAVVRLRIDPPPSEEPPRPVFQRLEWPDVRQLARTSEDLAVADRSLPGHGEDLTLWLRDSFSEQVEAFAVVRNLLPRDRGQARRIADLVPPLDPELYSSSLRRIRMLAATLSEPGLASLVAYRAGSAVLLERPEDLAAGDVLVIESRMAGEIKGDPDAAHPWGEHVRDLQDLHEQALTSSVAQTGDDRVPSWQARILIGDDWTERRDEVEPSALEEDLKLGVDEWQQESVDGNMEQLIESDNADAAIKSLLRAAVAYMRMRQAFTALAGLSLDELGERVDDPDWVANVDIQTVTSADPHVPWFVRLRPKWLEAVEDELSERGRRAVLLKDHVAGVAARTKEIANAVNASPEATAALTTSAELHDAGKEHERFQAYLRGGFNRTGQPLAKSGRHYGPVERRRYGITGWRHEQLSAVKAWSSPQIASRELVTWLVGTSHGRGRAAFDDDADGVLLASERLQEWKAAASELFDDGAWEDLHDLLSRRYGPWGLAYLEALLRSADQTVSAEGG